METCFIGVIPHKKWRSDVGNSYHKELRGAKYQCEINGGKNKYFYIEERYVILHKKKKWQLGNIKKIHHFNQESIPLEIEHKI